MDGYGLGMTMLQFMSRVYPTDAHLTNSGREYTPQEKEAIDAALADCIRLLVRMSMLKMTERMSAADAAAEIDRIVATYTVASRAMNNNAREELNRMMLVATGNTRVLNKTRRRRSFRK
jgi:hypothetical protein